MKPQSRFEQSGDMSGPENAPESATKQMASLSLTTLAFATNATKRNSRSIVLERAGEPEQATRLRLLNEGARLFLAHGYVLVSTRQICAAAGVTQPTLYHHFGNKEGLYLAVIEQWFHSTRAAILREVACGATLRERLHNIAAMFWSGEVGDFQSLQRDALQRLPSERAWSLSVTIVHSLIEPIAGAIHDAVVAGELPQSADPYALTVMYWALVDGLASAYQRGDPLPPPDMNVAAIELFVAGARAMESGHFAVWPARRKFGADPS